MSHKNRSHRALTTIGLWENRFGRHAKDRRVLANPDEWCSAYELDQVFRKYLPICSGRTLLEMGCGASRFLPYFNLALGFEITGIDYSETGCAAARERLSKTGAKGMIEERDFLKSNVDLEHRFDVVVSLGVVEHFEDTAEILKIFSRYLSPRGYLITYVPNYAGLMGWIRKRMEPPLYETHNIFNLKELVHFHEGLGFDILCAEYLEFLDFLCLPIDQLSKWPSFFIKNFFEAINRLRLFAYRRLRMNIQSPSLCTGMLTVARLQEG